MRKRFTTGTIAGVSIGMLLVAAGMVGISQVSAQPASGPFDSILALLQEADSTLEVSVAIDEGYCGTGGVQCGGADHAGGVASSDNHNPIRMIILVTKNGEGVAGLTQDDISFDTTFVPAGGPVVVACPGGGGCGSSLFLDDGAGSYALFLHPGPGATDWKAGNYYGEVNVTNPDGESGLALVEIEIE